MSPNKFKDKKENVLELDSDDYTDLQIYIELHTLKSFMVL